MQRVNGSVNNLPPEMQKGPPAEAEGPKVGNCVIRDFGMVFLRYPDRRANSSNASTVSS